MRLYEFKKSDKNIDVVVVTDGINDQKRVFITETPRGLPIPGKVMPKDDTNPNLAILEMGFNFVAGTEREHLDFILFAINNGLQLIQWNEGLGETTPVELVPENMEVEYSVTADPTTLSFAAAGETKSFNVKSIKTVTTEGDYKGMIIDVNYKTAITGDGFSLNGLAVTASANTGAVRSGTVTITQLEGDSPKTASVTLSQTAGA